MTANTLSTPRFLKGLNELSEKLLAEISSVFGREAEKLAYASKVRERGHLWGQSLQEVGALFAALPVIERTAQGSEESLFSSWVPAFVAFGVLCIFLGIWLQTRSRGQA